MKKLIPIIAAFVLLSGCTTLFQGTVTLTETMDSASKEYAKVFNDGLVTAAIDLKVNDAHMAYRKAAGVARDALYAYKVSGDPAQYNAALEAARQAVVNFIGVITPLISPSKAVVLKTQAQKAINL